MARKRNPAPKMGLHKPTGQARIRLGGTDVYLGPYGSPEAEEKYRRVLAEYLINPVPPPPKKESPAEPTVSELILAYTKHRNDERTEGLRNDERLALKLLRSLYGATPAAEFGPLKLRACRKAAIESGLCRKEINRRIRMVRRAFRWAASMEMIPGTVWQSLAAVEGLRAGTPGVREGEPVRPVPDEHVEAACKQLTPILAALVRFVRLTGCRMGEATSLRPIDIDRSPGTVWLYRPAGHKTAHLGKPRAIPIGPKARAFIAPYLEGAEPAEFLFSPAKSMAEWFSARGAARKTKAQPSNFNRKCRSGRKRATYRDRYGPTSIHKAIARACKRAGIPHWHPHQLRHAAATELRAKFGLEVARAVLGHTSVAMTDHYADQDASKAIEAMRELG